MPIRENKICQSRFSLGVKYRLFTVSFEISHWEHVLINWRIFTDIFSNGFFEAFSAFRKLSMASGSFPRLLEDVHGFWKLSVDYGCFHWLLKAFNCFWKLSMVASMEALHCHIATAKETNIAILINSSENKRKIKILAFFFIQLSVPFIYYTIILPTYYIICITSIPTPRRYRTRTIK